MSCLTIPFVRGGSRIFSRGGGRIFKNLRKCCRPFFRSTKLIFFKFCQSTKKSLFWPNFLPRRQIIKKLSKKGVFRQFLKILTKKLPFSARAPPSKLVYIDAEGAFRKNLGSVTKTGYLKIIQRGDPLGRQGVEFLNDRVLLITPPP